MKCGTHTTNAAAGTSSHPSIASTQAALRALHQTSGVDLYVTPERLLLLDTQPLMSPSVLLEQRGQVTTEATTREHSLELHSLKIALLMFSACHLVVSVHDEPDPLSLRLLRAAYTLHHRIPDVSALAQASPSALASLLAAASTSLGEVDELPQSIVDRSVPLAFVFNRSSPAAFDSSRLSALRGVLAKLFASQHSSTTGTGSSGAAASTMAGSSNAGEAHIALVAVLPESSSASCASDPGFSREAGRLRNELLALRRAAFARTTITERDWLKGIGHAWDLLRRSALLADYNKALQGLKLA